MAPLPTATGTSALPSEAVNQPYQEPRPTKCTFYDMTHSNNAARIRLWLRLKPSLTDEVDTVMVGHDDIDSAEYARINPLRKVPALITENGLRLFEAFVIMQYLEDRFPDVDDSLILDNPDDRAFVQLLTRCHDLYISSPNCTQPNFSHTQGCMYLDPMPTRFTPARRTMDTKTRAAKLAEIHKWLTWLEGEARMPYLAGQRMTHADLTWFPTAVFMELLLPKVFGWSAVFHETECFPKLAAWFELCLENESIALTRGEIRDTLQAQAAEGRFEAVRQDVEEHPEYMWKFM